MKKYLKLSLLLLAATIVLAGTALASYNVKTDINPAVNRFYMVDNETDGNTATKEFKLYSVDSSNGTASWTSAAIPGYCYGLKVNPAGTKLYVSVSNLANSKILIYTLGANGDPASTEEMTFGSYGYYPYPAGLDLISHNGNDYFLFVADTSSQGAIHYFNLQSKTWQGTLSVKNDYNGGAALANLTDIAVAPFSASYSDYDGGYVGDALLFAAQKAAAGKIFTYHIEWNMGYGNIGYTKAGTISSLSSPSYLKVSSDRSRLYAAVNGNTGDIFAYSISLDGDNNYTGAYLGAIKSPVTESTTGYGLNGFALSPDGKYVYYVQAQNATETATKLYKADITQLSGGITVNSTALNNDQNLGSSPLDSVVVTSDRTKVWVMDSGTGYKYSYSTGQSASTITITKPLHNDIYPIGSKPTVEWTISGDIARVKILYSTAGSTGPWSEIATVASSPASYNGWTIPVGTTPVLRNAYFKVVDADAPAISDIGDQFTIANKITVSQPDGTVTYEVNSPITVNWDKAAIGGQTVYNNVKVSYTSKQTDGWVVIEQNGSNDGACAFTPTTSGTLYQVKVEAVATVPNVGTSAYFTVIPKVTLTLPDANSKWKNGGYAAANNNGRIQWTCQDGGGANEIDRYALSYDNQYTNDFVDFHTGARTENSYDWTVNVVNPKTGLPASTEEMKIRIRALNAAGNIISEKVSPNFIVDNTAPAAPTAPAVETHGVSHNVWQNSVTQPVFTWTAPTDAAPSSGIAGYSYYWGTASNGEPGTTGPEITTASTASLNLTPQGPVTYLIARAFDGAGNYSAAVRMFTFKYDNVLPTISGNITSTTHPSPNGLSNNTSPSFSWNAATDTAPGAGLGNPTYYYLATNADISQNGTIPSNLIKTLGTGTNNTSIDLPNALNAQGLWHFYLVAQDAVGNLIESPKNYDIIIDTAAPAVTVTKPAAGTTVQAETDLEISFTATDTNVNNGRYSLSYTTDGTIYTPIQSAQNISCQLNGTAVTYNWSIPQGIISAANAAKIRVSVQDQAGNTTSRDSAGFTITTSNVAPTVALNSLKQRKTDSSPVLAAGALINQPSIVLEFTVSDTNTTDQLTPIFTVNGTDYQGTAIDTVPGQTYLARQTFPNLAETNYDWSVKVRDREGVTSPAVDFPKGTAAHAFSVDMTRPIVYSTDPNDNDANVAPDKPIIITFTEVNGLDPTTINSSNFKINGVGVTDQNIVFDAPAKKVTLNHANFGYGNKVDVMVEAGVGDLAGNTLLAAKSFSFTTGLQPRPKAVVTSILPNAGVRGTTINIVNLLGANFYEDTINNIQPRVTLTRQGATTIQAPVGSVKVISGNELTCVLPIPGDAQTGGYDVTVTNPDGQSSDPLVNGFTIYLPGTAPTVASIAPNVGRNNGTISNVEVTGSLFAAGTTVQLARTGENPIPADTTFNDSGRLTCSFNLLNKQVGWWHVIVTNSDGQQAILQNGFRVVTNPASTPTVTQVYPSRAPNDRGTIIKIIGTNFNIANQVEFLTFPAKDLAFTQDSDTMITATVPAGIDTGIYHLTVGSNNGPSDLTSADTFEVMAAPEDPLDPTKLSQVKDLVITPDDQRCKLDWTNPTDNDMATLELRRYTGTYPNSYDDPSGQLVYSEVPAPGSARTYTNTSLDNGTDYYYVVFIQDTSGHWSAVDHTAPDVNAGKGTPQILDTTPPAAVTNLVATPGANAGEVNLSWTAPGDDGMTGKVASYEVRYATSNSPFVNPFTDANFATTGTVADTSSWTNFVDGGLAESNRVIGNLTHDPIRPTYTWIAIKAFDDATPTANIGPLGASSTAETFVKDSVPTPTVTKVYPRRMPSDAANTIVIVGTNFNAAALVQLSGASSVPLASFSFISATQILATVPSGTPVGLYDVRVTTGGGQSAINAPADQVTVFDPSITPDTTRPQVTDLGVSTDQVNQCALTWTNPNGPTDDDLASLEVRRYDAAGGYPAAHDSGAGTLIFTEIPEPGTPKNYLDGNLTPGNYIYVVFIRDTSGNWSNVDSTLPEVNAATGTAASGGPDIIITNLNIVRDGNNVGSSVTISWQTSPTPHDLRVKIYYKTDNYNSTPVDWTPWDNPVIIQDGNLDKLVDPSQVGQGTAAKFYKVIPASKSLERSDLTSEVVGKFNFQLTEGMNLIALPLIPTGGTSLAEIFGTQLTGSRTGDMNESDVIWKYNSASASRYDYAWLVEGLGDPQYDNNWFDPDLNPSTLTVDPDLGYWIQVKPGNATPPVTIVGKISSGPRTITTQIGMNLIGSAWPVETAIANSALNGPATGSRTGDMNESDVIWKYNSASPSRYDYAWLVEGLGDPQYDDKWFDPDLNPATIKFTPGKGYWVQVKPSNSGFTWNYNVELSQF